MAYVLPTLVAMGIGYAITESRCASPAGLRWTWLGFWLVIGGTVMAGATTAAGKSSVLYTSIRP
jgi:cytochrome c oxidase subunit 1